MESYTGVYSKAVLMHGVAFSLTVLQLDKILTMTVLIFSSCSVYQLSVV